MSKRLILPILLLIVLLSSCSTTDESKYLKLAQEATTLKEKTKYYLTGYETNPENLKYIYNSAYFLSLEERYSEAETILKQGLTLYSKAINLYTLLSFIYEKQYKFASFERTLNTLLVIDPGYKEASVKLLAHYLMLLNYKKALPLAETLYNTYPTEQSVLDALSVLKGGVFTKLASPEETKKEAKKALTAPYLPPLDIKLEQVISSIKSSSSLSAL